MNTCATCGAPYYHAYSASPKCSGCEKKLVRYAFADFPTIEGWKAIMEWRLKGRAA